MKKRSKKSSRIRRTPLQNNWVVIIVFAFTASMASLSIYAQTIKNPPPGVFPITSSNTLSNAASNNAASANLTLTCSAADKKNAKSGPCYQGNNTTIGSGCTNQTAGQCLSNQTGFIKSYLQPVVDVLSGLVAIVVVGVIVAGGVQYSMAGNSPEAVNAARRRITNGLIALGVFLITYAFLQWLIPGGVF